MPLLRQLTHYWYIEQLVLALQIQKDAARGEKIPPNLAFLDTHQAPCMVVVGQHFKDGRFMATFLNQVLRNKSCKLMTALLCSSYRCKMHVAAASIGVSTKRPSPTNLCIPVLVFGLTITHDTWSGHHMTCMHHGMHCSASQRSLLCVMLQHDHDKVNGSCVLDCCGAVHWPLQSM